jgi:alpha-galactosidase
MFALWAVMKSPLLIGTDIRTASAATRATLQAVEVIAINQDPLYVAGDLVWRNGPNRVYAAPLADGSRAAVLFNAHTHSSQYPAWNITLNFATLGYKNSTAAVVRDLFAQADLGTYTGTFTGAVPLHGVLALKVTPVSASERDVTWRPWLAAPYAS